MALSSTNRPKETYWGERPRERTEPVDSFAVNEAALFLLSMVAANLMHAGRLLAQHPNAQFWPRETFRRLVLQAPGQVARSSRYVTLWIHERWAAPWTRIGRALRHLPPAQGSPALPALPLPALHPPGRGARSQGGPPTAGGEGTLPPHRCGLCLSQARTPSAQESSRPKDGDELPRISIQKFSASLPGLHNYEHIIYHLKLRGKTSLSSCSNHLRRAWERGEVKGAERRGMAPQARTAGDGTEPGG